MEIFGKSSLRLYCKSILQDSVRVRLQWLKRQDLILTHIPGLTSTCLIIPHLLGGQGSGLTLQPSRRARRWCLKEAILLSYSRPRLSAAKDLVVILVSIKHCTKCAVKTGETPFFALSTPSLFLCVYNFWDICLLLPCFLLRGFDTRQRNIISSITFLVLLRTDPVLLPSCLSPEFYACYCPCSSAPWVIWQQHMEVMLLFKLLLKTWDSKVFITFFAQLSSDTSYTMNSLCES